MGIKTQRTKPRNYLESFIYRICKILPFRKSTKFRFFLDLEWIFDRLAHECSFDMYSEDEHPIRIYSKNFILKRISASHNVLDLGCNKGVISNYIAKKAKKVVGIDFNIDAISCAKRTYDLENLSFEVGEALKYLKMQTIDFDVLILSHILEHLDEPKEFLLNHVSCFKYIYIEVPDFDRNFLNHYRKIENNKLIYSDKDHIHEFDRYEIRELCDDCGLKIVEEEFIFGVQKYWCKVQKK